VFLKQNAWMQVVLDKTDNDDNLITAMKHELEAALLREKEARTALANAAAPLDESTPPQAGVHGNCSS